MASRENECKVNDDRAAAPMRSLWDQMDKMSDGLVLESVPTAASSDARGDDTVLLDNVNKLFEAFFGEPCSTQRLRYVDFVEDDPNNDVLGLCLLFFYPGAKVLETMQYTPKEIVRRFLAPSLTIRKDDKLSIYTWKFHDTRSRQEAFEVQEETEEVKFVRARMSVDDISLMTVVKLQPQGFIRDHFETMIADMCKTGPVVPPGAAEEKVSDDDSGVEGLDRFTHGILRNKYENDDIDRHLYLLEQRFGARVVLGHILCAFVNFELLINLRSLEDRKKQGYKPSCYEWIYRIRANTKMDNVKTVKDNLFGHLKREGKMHENLNYIISKHEKNIPKEVFETVFDHIRYQVSERYFLRSRAHSHSMDSSRSTSVGDSGDNMIVDRTPTGADESEEEELPDDASMDTNEPSEAPIRPDDELTPQEREKEIPTNEKPGVMTRAMTSKMTDATNASKKQRTDTANPSTPKERTHTMETRSTNPGNNTTRK